jgi:putative tryptophan/tyrosine transport system substrate-binding protein
VVIPFYSQTDRKGQASIAAFLDTFQRLGWTDGRNVRIDTRWGGGDPQRAKTTTAELVRSAPDAIVVAGSLVLAELQRLTSSPTTRTLDAGLPANTSHFSVANTTISDVVR